MDRVQSFRMRRWVVVSVVVVSVVDDELLMFGLGVVSCVVVVVLSEADVSTVGALRSTVGAAGTVTCVVLTVAGCVFVMTV